MFYTLAKGLIWYLLALILGIIIGYLWRSLTANRQLARARNAAGSDDSAEVERLKGRVANLEPVVAERDRLRQELDECRATAAANENAAAVGGAAAGLALSGTPAATSADVVVVSDADVVADADVAAVGASVDAGVGSGGATTSVQGFATPPPPPDLSEAAAILGKKIKFDDLTVVEGIGPAIRDLCQGIGVSTWYELSITEVSLLRTMLHDAGPRFQMHDPQTWPQQAGLLAAGKWTEFKELTDRLDGGRPV